MLYVLQNLYKGNCSPFLHVLQIMNTVQTVQLKLTVRRIQTVIVVGDAIFCVNK